MWTLFNPVNQDLKYEINHSVWTLHIGETKKFPNEVAAEMVKITEFLEVLDKDDHEPKVKLPKPPKDLSKVKEAVPEDFSRDMRLKHPTSDPNVLSRSNFIPHEDRGIEGYQESAVGLELKQTLSKGKLVQMDRDGVEWYGNGVTKDNPFVIDKED